MYSLSVPKENDKTSKDDIDNEIKRLMDTYGNDVLRTSFMFLKDVQKAEDAFQEVFIKAFKKFGTFRGESSEKTWIIKITVNVCKDMLRSQWFRRVLLTDKLIERGAGRGIEDRIIKAHENRRLFDEVLSLRPAFREVVILYYYNQYDTVEIGKILNIAEGTVRSRLHRAREILKSNLEGRTDFGE